MNDNSLYLLIGGNQGDRAALLQQATDLIRQRIGSVAHLSPIYRTEPWGIFAPNEKPQDFFNQALHVLTPLSPIQALEAALQIEQELGRQRNANANVNANANDLPVLQDHLYSSRPIDIDLIFYNQLIVDNPPTLLLPHPRAHLRAFVLKPLCDIAPNYLHPVFQCTLTELLSKCPDSSPCLPLL